jgi:hypothetical protein
VTNVVERYLTLGLRLGKHVDGLVDAYYGPAELSQLVDAEQLLDPSDLVAEADSLASDVQSAELDAQRKGWLGDQVRGLRVYAGVLAGEAPSYADEVEGCYGVRPERWSEDAYRAVHEQLDELLPGSGPLRGRYENWREDHAVPSTRMVPALVALAAVLRTRTSRLVELPDGEALDIEEVRDEPWWAFNYYLGDLRSRVVMNVDQLTTTSDLVMLASHEAYPGHHTEHAVKEQLLIRDGGRLEEAIQLVPTPQAVVSEGIAETGLEIVLDDELEHELGTVLEAQGLKVDLKRSLAIDRARRPLRRIGLDAALLVHEHGASIDEARTHVERWGLGTTAQAAHTVRFVTDPTWRAYAITYSAGQDLCGSYAAGDPSRFRTLLTEQVRVADLLAARG